MAEFFYLIVIPLVLLRNCILKPREMQMEGSRYNYFFQDLFCGREQVKGLHFFPTDQRSSERVLFSPQMMEIISSHTSGEL